MLTSLKIAKQTFTEIAKATMPKVGRSQLLRTMEHFSHTSETINVSDVVKVLGYVHTTRSSQEDITKQCALRQFRIIKNIEMQSKIDVKRFTSTCCKCLIVSLIAFSLESFDLLTMNAVFRKQLHQLFRHHHQRQQRFLSSSKLSRRLGSFYQMNALYNSGSIITPFSQIRIARKISQDIDTIQNSISKDLKTLDVDLSECSKYQFERTTGKHIRPKVICCIARAVNNQIYSNNYSHGSCITEKQQEVAKIAEMIHTASLIHDDVIDDSDLRRSKPTVRSKWGSKKAILTGDYILAVASRLLAGLRNPDVIILLARVIEDLVTGEFMQLRSTKEHINFENYLKRIYLKTASLFANSSKACSLLVSSNEELSELAFGCGNDIGMAFQIVDDLLDITGDVKTLGKATLADLKGGISTLPVIFAIEEYPEILNRLRQDDQSSVNFEEIANLINNTKAIDRTKSVAQSYIRNACLKIDSISPHSEESELFKHYAEISNLFCVLYNCSFCLNTLQSDHTMGKIEYVGRKGLQYGKSLLEICSNLRCRGIGRMVCNVELAKTYPEVSYFTMHKTSIFNADEFYGFEVYRGERRGLTQIKRARAYDWYLIPKDEEHFYKDRTLAEGELYKEIEEVPKLIDLPPALAEILKLEFAKLNITSEPKCVRHNTDKYIKLV
ncbi:hypothetical protein GJ496_011900 [Pomphorhynchus laevis]|nr:hypothetical protein GJ496_011900 [Pomphorhynchus laevis]